MVVMDAWRTSTETARPVGPNRRESGRRSEQRAGAELAIDMSRPVRIYGVNGAGFLLASHGRRALYISWLWDQITLLNCTGM